MTIGKRSSLPELVERKLDERKKWETLYANDDFPLWLTHKTNRDKMIPDMDLPEEILTEWLNDEGKQEPDLEIFS